MIDLTVQLSQASQTAGDKRKRRDLPCLSRHKTLVLRIPLLQASQTAGHKRKRRKLPCLSGH